MERCILQTFNLLDLDLIWFGLYCCSTRLGDECLQTQTGRKVITFLKITTESIDFDGNELYENDTAKVKTG